MPAPTAACLAFLAGLLGGPASGAPLEEASAALARGDVPAAVGLLTPLADGGDPEAMTRLAVLYHKGEGVTRDAAKAAELYTRAAASGNAEAQFNLGNMYLLGEGVPQDDDWAFTYYRQAAAQGHELARKNVSEFYRAAGMAPPEFPPAPAGGAAALPATLSAAGPATGEADTADEDTSIPADSVVGLIPREVSPDELRALQLARAHGIYLERVPVEAGLELADQGPPPLLPEPSPPPVPLTPQASLSTENLARLSRAELEILADAREPLAQLEIARRASAAGQDVEARMWLKQAAGTGNAEAQFALAESCRKEDEVEAISWYRAAARQGHQGAYQALEAMYRAAGLNMPPLGVPAPRAENGP